MAQFCGLSTISIKPPMILRSLTPATAIVAGLVLTAHVLPAASLPPVSGASMVLKNYDGTSVPTNREGNQYPYWSDGNGGEGGKFTASIDTTSAVVGNSLKAHLVAQSGTGNAFYAQFNPYDGVTRGFAREYAASPSAWRFNTYNRMSFWIKIPNEPSRIYSTDGSSNANVGAYAKCVAATGCPNDYSDEDGGGHFYYNQNWPHTGTWVHVLLNGFVDHWRGNNGNTEEPSALHPTNEANYNLFDALTRFYFQDNSAPLTLPADYGIDEISFYQETFSEPDQQVRDIAATFVPQSNRVIVTWSRNKNEDSVNFELRYSFTDIHQGGWNSATAAPSGTVRPAGTAGYNGVFYDTTALPLSGKTLVYVGIRPMANNPQNLFTQVAIPLVLGGTATPPPTLPAAPSNLRVTGL
jgi:hypothetical protein